MNEQISVALGRYCRDFRKYTLNKTLKEMNLTISYKTLSSFENAKNKNLANVFEYLRECQNDEQKIEFLDGVHQTIKGVVTNHGY